MLSKCLKNLFCSKHTQEFPKNSNLFQSVRMTKRVLNTTLEVLAGKLLFLDLYSPLCNFSSKRYNKIWFEGILIRDTFWNKSNYYITSINDKNDYKLVDPIKVYFISLIQAHDSGKKWPIYSSVQINESKV